MGPRVSGSRFVAHCVVFLALSYLEAFPTLTYVWTRETIHPDFLGHDSKAGRYRPFLGSHLFLLVFFGHPGESAVECQYAVSLALLSCQCVLVKPRESHRHPFSAEPSTLPWCRAVTWSSPLWTRPPVLFLRPSPEHALFPVPILPMSTVGMSCCLVADIPLGCAS